MPDETGNVLTKIYVALYCFRTLNSNLKNGAISAEWHKITPAKTMGNLIYKKE